MKILNMFIKKLEKLHLYYYLFDQILLYNVEILIVVLQYKNIYFFDFFLSDIEINICNFSFFFSNL